MHMLLKEITGPISSLFLSFALWHEANSFDPACAPAMMCCLTGYNGASVSQTDTSKMLAKINPRSLQVDMMYIYLHYLYTNISLYKYIYTAFLCFNASFYFKKLCAFLMVICFVMLGMEARALHTARKYFTTKLYSHSPPTQTLFLPGVVHSLTFRSLEAKKADLCEFKANPVYVVSSKLE